MEPAYRYDALSTWQHLGRAAFHASRPEARCYPPEDDPDACEAWWQGYLGAWQRADPAKVHTREARA